MVTSTRLVGTGLISTNLLCSEDEYLGRRLTQKARLSYSRLFAFICGQSSVRVFWPRMLRIAPAQFASNLWIEPLPKACQIRRRLDRALIRRQQMNY